MPRETAGTPLSLFGREADKCFELLGLFGGPRVLSFVANPQPDLNEVELRLRRYWEIDKGTNVWALSGSHDRGRIELRDGKELDAEAYRRIVEASKVLRESPVKYRAHSFDIRRVSAFGR